MPGGLQIWGGPVFGLSIATVLGNFGQICVGLFMFLAGYGLFFSMKKDNFRLYKKVADLYLRYWRVFIIFVPLGFLFFRNQPDYMINKIRCHLFDGFNIQDFFLTFFGVRCSYNYEWWFFKAYLVFIVLGYVYIKLTGKLDWKKEIAAIIIIDALLIFAVPAIKLPVVTENALFHLIRNGREGACAAVFAGIYCAKYNLIGRAYAGIPCFLKKALIGLILSLVALTGLVFLRDFVCGIELDSVYSFAVIICVLLATKNFGILKTIMKFFGEHSTSIWLIHTFYCYYFFAMVRVVYSFKNLFLDYLILVLLSTLTAFVLDAFWNKIHSALKSKLRIS